VIVGKSNQEEASSVKSFVKNKIIRPIGNFIDKVTSPLTKSGAWIFLRRYILRSPFKGYFVNSFLELKNVQWPDRKTSLKLTFTVILFSAFFAAFTTALDYGFVEISKRIFLR